MTLSIAGIADIAESTLDIAQEVISARLAAHAKQGDNSIEALAGNSPLWQAVLGEEGGEVGEAMRDVFVHTILSRALGRVAHAGTYDADKSRLREELVDVLSVATAWIAAIDAQKASAEGSDLS
jgi:hypothetical protein